MLLAVEDPAFYSHNGMDLSTPGAGLTTITQALVKLLYFDPFRPGISAKLKQTLIAVFALDALVSKETQLLLFVNIVYLGRNGSEQIWGFADAAEAYFDKEFRELTDEEYLALVGMIIAPNGVHVRREPARNAERVARIKRVLSGDYQPKGLMDFYYDADAGS
jgi:membrane peptidoglycan carboxypeptidase